MTSADPTTPSGLAQPTTEEGHQWLIDLTVRSGGEALAAEWALEVGRRILTIESEARAEAEAELAVVRANFLALLDEKKAVADLALSQSFEVERLSDRLVALEAALTPERLTTEIDRHWLRLELPMAVCTCGGWSANALDPETSTLDGVDLPIMPAFSGHVAAALRAALLEDGK